MSEWKTVRLGDVCILEKGQQIDTSLLDDSKTYHYINGGIKESGYFDKFNTSGESVLISEGGASCGYINYVNEDIWCGCHCYRLHDIKVFPKYLFHALKANQQRIMALRTGSAMPNIQKSTIQKFQLKIHDDLTTQKNISTMLDKCNELIEKYKKILEKYDTLIKSRFIELFGDPVQNPKGWNIKTLNEVCRKITDGKHGGCKLDEKSDYYYVGAREIFDLNIHYETAQNITKEDFEKDYKRCNLEIGDFCIVNTGATIGKTAIAKDKRTTHTLLQKSVALLKVKPEEIIPIYLQYSYITNESMYKVESASAQPNLLLSKIRETKLMVPPIASQNQFASFVQQIDKSKFAVQKSLEKAETLYKSLMQEYFG